MAAQAADPNIIVPAIIAAVPVTIAAVAGMIVTLRGVRKRNDETQANTDAAASKLLEAITGVKTEVSTNNGMRAGEYLERVDANLTSLMEWAVVHTEEDNQIRTELGLRPGKAPTWS